MICLERLLPTCVFSLLYAPGVFRPRKARQRCKPHTYGAEVRLIYAKSSTIVFRQSADLHAGFVGSGPIVLFLEVVDQIGPHPMQSQRILLFTVVAFFTFLGMILSLSLWPCVVVRSLPCRQ